MTFIECPGCDEVHDILLESDEAYIAPTVEVSEVGSCDPVEGGWVCNCGTVLTDAEIDQAVEAAREDAALAAAGV